jgi:hypothetical protein
VIVTSANEVLVRERCGLRLNEKIKKENRRREEKGEYNFQVKTQVKIQALQLKGPVL